MILAVSYERVESWVMDTWSCILMHRTFMNFELPITQMLKYFLD